MYLLKVKWRPDPFTLLYSLEKNNLTYRRYDGLNHFWTDTNGQNQINKVIGDLLAWLEALLRSPR